MFKCAKKVGLADVVPPDDHVETPERSETLDVSVGWRDRPVTRVVLQGRVGGERPPPGEGDSVHDELVGYSGRGRRIGRSYPRIVAHLPDGRARRSSGRLIAVGRHDVGDPYRLVGLLRSQCPRARDCAGERSGTVRQKTSTGCGERGA